MVCKSPAEIPEASRHSVASRDAGSKTGWGIVLGLSAGRETIPRTECGASVEGLVHSTDLPKLQLLDPLILSKSSKITTLFSERPRLFATVPKIETITNSQQSLFQNPLKKSEMPGN